MGNFFCYGVFVRSLRIRQGRIFHKAQMTARTIPFLRKSYNDYYYKPELEAVWTKLGHLFSSMKETVIHAQATANSTDFPYI